MTLTGIAERLRTHGKTELHADDAHTTALFIVGRIKDLLIVYGRNHSPDDIEVTVQEIIRAAARR